MDYEVDLNLKNLVKLINVLEDLSTFSSCGGHDNPNPNQQPRGQFVISLQIEPTRSGLNSLGLIQTAINSHPQNESLILIAWLSANEPDSVAFSLEGHNNAKPEVLADLLHLVIETYGTSPPSDWKPT
ncbi:hypothetical protein [Gimesia sp.]|uniref:hypothetical protein n=1 Tax=Gimesia sp. TaxID=2024833 RepID=UPI003A914D90